MQCIFLLHSCCPARVTVVLWQVVYVFGMASSCTNSIKSSNQLACSIQTEGESHTDSEAHYSSLLCDRDQNTAKSKCFWQRCVVTDMTIILKWVFNTKVFQKLDVDSWARLQGRQTRYKPSLTYMSQCEHTQYQTVWKNAHAILC